MDRLLRYVRDIRQATYFDIQNVADYYFAYGEEKWTYEQFCLAPPFDFFATKFRTPAILGNIFGGLDILTTIRVVDRPQPGNIPHLISEDNQINPYSPAVLPDANWHLEFNVFSADGRRVGPSLTFFAAVGDHGQLLTYRGYNALWITDMSTDGMAIVANTNLQISMLALTFLHSKNVEVLDPPPPTKKRLPRKRKFEVRYHRLRVRAIGQQHAQSAAGTGIRQSLHIVRGHFRQYGTGGRGKLFGKWTGRYWVAGHLKGDLDTGAVAKDYEVEPPELEA